MPGVQKIIPKLEEGINDLQNLAPDFSDANIANFFLPLALSIPPISLIETVSDMATISYVIATDIIAPFPLLLKGIMLVHTVLNRKGNFVRGVGISGRNYVLLRLWKIRGTFTGILKLRMGVAFIVVSLWFMAASVYTEYLCWRANRYRTRRTKD